MIKLRFCGVLFIRATLFSYSFKPFCNLFRLSNHLKFMTIFIPENIRFLAAIYLKKMQHVHHPFEYDGTEKKL